MSPDTPPLKHSHHPSNRGLIWLHTLGALLCVLYVALALTPSSYALGLQFLGLEPDGLLLGTPRKVRSDEWIVLTPYFQIAVANGLAEINQLSPYQESLRTFQALPVLNWGMLFKPYHWGFLVLPAAYAFSFFYMTMMAAFVAGWALFLRQLRLPPLPALLVALTLFFAPFVQVWWSSNAGSFALAPWVALCWICIEKRWLRILLSSYALAVWMLANAYPPFLYTLGFGMLILVLAFRRDMLSLTRCIDAVLASALALAVFVGYFGELIAIMHDTIYPGQRISHAGGLSWARFFVHFFPGLTTGQNYEPLPKLAGNASEIAALSSLLPIYALTLIDTASLRQWARNNRPGMIALLAGLSFIAGWSFLKLPDWFGRITGLYMVAPGRALLAFGLILNIASAVALVRCGVRVTWARLGSLLLLTLAGSGLKTFFAPQASFELYSWTDKLPYLCLLGVAALYALPILRPHMTGVVLIAAVACNAGSYGLFNPIQSAKPIFALDRDAVEREVMARGAQKADDGTLAAPGHYGALLAGAGLRSVNHVLYAPRLAYFRTHFPELPTDTFETLFNRFSHVSVAGNAPYLIQADHVSVPANAFLHRAAPPQITLSRGTERLQVLTQSDLPAGYIDVMNYREDGEVTLTGWLRTPLDEPTEVQLWASVPYTDVSLTRFARPDLAAAVGPSLLNSGVSITLTLPPDKETVEICLVVRDAQGADSTVIFPSGQKGCVQTGTQ
ncbi:MAG: hypothetical protein Q4A16_08900 [Lautropia sp.]|nr:hypothetical protein [Lautropia sp.]